MEAIGYILLIVVGCLIPVVGTVLIVADARTGRGPDFEEAAEMFCVLIVYGVVAWVFLFTIASVLHGILS